MLSRYQNITTSLPFSSRKALRTTCREIVAGVTAVQSFFDPQHPMPELLRLHPSARALIMLLCCLPQAPLFWLLFETLTVYSQHKHCMLVLMPWSTRPVLSMSLLLEQAQPDKD